MSLAWRTKRQKGKKLPCPAGDLNQNLARFGIIDKIMNYSDKEQPVTLVLFYFE